MASHPKPTALIRSLPATVPFVGPESQERQRGRPFKARIGANESVFGPSPKVIKAMAAAAPDMWKYCDPESFELRTALAQHLGVAANNLVIGEGIDGLLGMIVRLFVSENTPVVTSLGAYPTFNYHVAGFGGRLVTVAYRNDHEDLDGLAAAVRLENAPLVYLSNPDNPMGTWWNGDAIAAFADSLPEETMLVLDEAYGETAPRGALMPLLPLRGNVLRLRTFSKVYGLAGLRCGYAIGVAETIAVFERIRSHFGVNRMAQVAAITALEDSDYLLQAIDKIADARTAIAEIGLRNGLEPVESATNFVALDCGTAERSGEIMKALIDAGIFVRRPGVPVLDRCVRISAGTPQDLALFETALAAAVSR